MRKYFFFYIFLFTASVYAAAQVNEVNQYDSEGRKTGVWDTFYENGKLKSHATFKEGHPVGELLKYYPGGILKTKMFFDQSGRTSYVKIYYETGELAAEGKFIDQLKDSIWNYYSSYDKRKAIAENYLEGKKNGENYKYYPNGKISEYIEWKNDIKDGKWEQYFENGQIRLTGTYTSGMLTGSFISYNSDGSLSVTGSYTDGLMDGKWDYFTEEGEPDITVEYVKGQMLPNPEVEKRAREFSQKIIDLSGNELDDSDIPEY